MSKVEPDPGETTQDGFYILDRQYSQHIRHLSAKNKTTVAGHVCNVKAMFVRET